MNLRPILYIVPALLCAAAACSDDNDLTGFDGQTPVQLMELATITATEPSTALEVYRPGTDIPIPLLAGQQLQGGKVGQRILVYYRAEVADTALRPVPVTIISAGAIPYGEAEAADYAALSDELKIHYSVLSQWHTGPWLNMQVKVRVGEEYTLGVVADEKTLEADTVDCYLVGKTSYTENAYVDRRTYVSYDISKVVSRAGQTVRLVAR